MTIKILTKPRHAKCRTQTAYCNNQCDTCTISVDTTIEELRAQVGFEKLLGYKRPGDGLNRWKISIRKPELTNKTWWSTWYADTPHEALRIIASHTKRGIKTKFTGKIYHHPKFGAPYYYYGPMIQSKDLEEWLLAEDSRYGYPREFWEYTMKQVKIDLGDLPPEGEFAPRWRVTYGPYKNTNQNYYDDPVRAIRRYLAVEHTKENPILQVQVIAGRWKEGSSFIPEDGDGIFWLLEKEQTLGRPREYWKNIIDSMKEERENGSREIKVEHREIPDELAFRLSDIPPEMEVRLTDELVIALDKVNRPYRYKPGWLTRNRIWPTAHPFTKRLWDDYARFRRRGKVYDRGAFITRAQVDDVLAKTTLTEEQMEQHIIGLRWGSSTIGNQLELSLPVTPNKWWAKIFGFWFSAGGYHYRDRKGKGSEAVLRFSIDSTVVPLFMEAAKMIGSIPYRRYDKPSQAIKAMDLRARPKSTMILNRCAIPILEKFGLQLPTLEQRPKATQQGGRKKAAKIYNVIIPQWILDDDENMHSFIEGYLNGQLGASMMNSHTRSIKTHVYIRFSSDIPEQGEIMGEHVNDYLVRKYGMNIHSNRMQRRPPRTPTWELRIAHREHLFTLMNNFEIARVGMRARLLMTEAIQIYPVLWMAVRKLNSTQIVLLGVIYEAPIGYTEMREALPVRPEVLDDSLKLMKELNVVKEVDGVWSIDYPNLTARIKDDQTRRVKILQSRAAAYSERLLFQCSNCSQIYIKARETCGICEEEVVSVSRRKVLRSINNRMGKIKSRLEQIEKSEPQIAKR